jgi:hypothetical protein
VLPPAEFDLMLQLLPELGAPESQIPLRPLLDGLREGFFTLDSLLRFGEMNNAAERHFGLCRQTVTG